MTEHRQLPKWLPVVVVLVAVAATAAWEALREAKNSCIYAYVSSVQNAIELFHQKHQRWPDNLIEIDQSLLDYDCGCALSELDYEITDKGAIVSYGDGHKRIYPSQVLMKASE